MLAFGKDELGGPVERRMKCPFCGEFHEVKDSAAGKEWDHDTETWVQQKVGGAIQFYECGGDSYLVGIDGRALPEG